MSLTKPILLTTAAFNAKNPHTIYFNVIGGSQVTKNKLTIRLNDESNKIVYESVQETYKFEHIITPSPSTPEQEGLINGKYYNAVLTTFDKDGNESQPSNIIQFRCYTTPIIEFTNLPIANLIQNASFNFEFSYNQLEGEVLNSYEVNLYNGEKKLISTSGINYTKLGTPPYFNSYLFAGFENKKSYFIELNARTVNGTEVTTGLIQINISYIKPDIFTLMEIVNRCEEGYISVKSNITAIEGKANPSPAIFIDDKEVDLTGIDSWVEFNDGFSLNRDFLMRIWFRSPNNYKEIIKFSNTKGQTITLTFMKGYENLVDGPEKVYIEMYVKSIAGLEAYNFSNYILPLANNEYYNLWLTRKNNLYNLEIGKV